MSEFDFIELFYSKLKVVSPNWYVKGLIDSNQKVYSLGTDSKLIGRIFELKVNKVLKAIEDDNGGYKLNKPTVQTEYPDFFFECPDGKRIAVDVKTSYRDTVNGKKRVSYTLGSYKSYLRDGKKGICGNDYSLYKKHYVIGFIYDRVHADDGEEYEIDDLDRIVTPYDNVEVWVQEKYKITGCTEGSGNTTNIGSINGTEAKDFAAGAGPFSYMDKSVCDDYWRCFDKKYKTVDAYFEWLRKEKKWSDFMDQQEEKYLEWKRIYEPTEEQKIERASEVVFECGPKGGIKDLF